MVKKRILKYKSVWDEEDVAATFSSKGVKPIHLKRLYRHLARNPDVAWNSIPDFPRAASEALDEHFVRVTTVVEEVQTSADGETTKLLMRLQDGLKIEAVIMRYDGSSSAGPGEYRKTLCVSSQVGCQMGCTFCATGTMGLSGNLTSGEILEQLVVARKLEPIRNVVFMGMGEPLSNYEAVRTAVLSMTNPERFGLARAHVTISTVGVIPRIRQLGTDLPGVSLALSLHAPEQTLRVRLVPSARAYPLDRLLDAVRDYQATSRQKIFLEYVLLAGVNDGPEQAHMLGLLSQTLPEAMVNLIPWNPVHSPGLEWKAPSPASTTQFQAILANHYRVACTVRQEKGQDIAGACGQLVVERASAGCGSARSPIDIEELMSGAPSLRVA